MEEFRLYFFEAGHIRRVEALTAPDDLAAVKTAHDLADHMVAELWCGARKIHVFNAQPGTLP